MKRNWANLVAALLALVLSGCATMTADECVTGDWRAIGYEDGSRGYTTDQFGKHRKACAKHGVTPDFAAYRQGRDQGLEEFCQPGRGFDYGASGGHYRGVCPAHLETEYLEAFRAGNKLYSLRAAVSNVNSAIYAREAELERIEDRNVAIAAELIGEDTTTEQRVLLLGELKDLAEREGEIETEIQQLIADRARLEQELSYYEQTVAAYGY